MKLNSSDPECDAVFVDRILYQIKNHQGVLTPKEVISMVRDEAGFNRKQAKSLIAFLVSKGELEYVDVYGRTCLALSFNRPVRVSKRVVLKPPECSFKSQAGDVVINLAKGTAFGRGAHPTTSLCIRALDWLSEHYPSTLTLGLDIGTGTGVLALVAAKLIADNIEACDIDPMAIHEARENVRLNKLENRVCVSDRCDFSQTHDLILANLRYPTLISLMQDFANSLSQNGWVVLSGIKNEELQKVRSCYEENFQMIRTENEGGWSALIYTPL